MCLELLVFCCPSLHQLTELVHSESALAFVLLFVEVARLIGKILILVRQDNFYQMPAGSPSGWTVCRAAQLRRNGEGGVHT